MKESIMNKLWGLVVCALFATANVSVNATPANRDAPDQSERWAAAVEAVVSSQKTTHSADEDVHVTVAFTNNGTRPIAIPRFMLDANEIDRSFLTVTRNGAPVAYTGPLVKRSAPSVEDMVSIAPGEIIAAQYELSSVFQLNEGGNYEVNFVNSNKHFVGGRTIASMAVNLDIAPSTRIELPTPDVSLKAGGAGGISYTGRCTASQKSALEQAVTAGATYADQSASYLNGGSVTARYTTWFGAYSATNYSTVKSHFNLIANALNTKALTLDCSCKKRDTFAYVYAAEPYKIYLCGAFWSAALRGTDSRAGTLVHEMSHFTVNGGTKDYAYGQSLAKQLAISNPAQAVQNADSHEYFAENTPAQ
jgi:peptidyl-Lys metalloendopeptidase